MTFLRGRSFVCRFPTQTASCAESICTCLSHSWTGEAENVDRAPEGRPEDSSQQEKLTDASDQKAEESLEDSSEQEASSYSGDQKVDGSLEDSSEQEASTDAGDQKAEGSLEDSLEQEASTDSGDQEAEGSPEDSAEQGVSTDAGDQKNEGSPEDSAEQEASMDAEEEGDDMIGERNEGTPCTTFKSNSCYDAVFVVTGGTAGCHYGVVFSIIRQTYLPVGFTGALL